MGHYNSAFRDFLSPELLKRDHFKLDSLVAVEDMFRARVHFGHKVTISLLTLQIGTLHPNMKWAVFGERLGVCIIDLEVVREFLLRYSRLLYFNTIRALNFTAHVAARGGMILFVSSHRETMLNVERIAEECGEVWFFFNE